MVTVTEVVSEPDLSHVRALIREFVDWARDLSPQDRHLVDRYFDPVEFEAELAGLPGRYAAPSGRLLLARLDGKPVGCVAMRQLDAGICEMKRMFVRPACHGQGVGKALARHLIAEAQASGYRAMRLDTSRNQSPAIGLYEGLGFRRVAAYYDVPAEFEGFLLFFEKDLAQAA